MTNIRSQMEAIVAQLRALNLAYHHAHINVRGSSYYGDHLLLQRLYFGEEAGAPILEIDSFMERLRGLFPEAPLNPLSVAQATAERLRPLQSLQEVNNAYWHKLTRMEDELQIMLAATSRAVEDRLAQDGRWSSRGDGLLNLLQDTADKHQVNLYLLQQRLEREDIAEEAPLANFTSNRNTEPVHNVMAVNGPGWCGMQQVPPVSPGACRCHRCRSWGCKQPAPWVSFGGWRGVPQMRGPWSPTSGCTGPCPAIR